MPPANGGRPLEGDHSHPLRGRAGPDARRPPLTRAVFLLERQRKLSIRDENDNLVRFRYLRPVSDRNGPCAWSPEQKLEFLLGMSLDGIYEIMSWPIGERDPFSLSVRMQVTLAELLTEPEPLNARRVRCPHQ